MLTLALSSKRGRRAWRYTQGLSRVMPAGRVSSFYK